MTPGELADVLRTYAQPRYSIEPFVVTIRNQRNGAQAVVPLEDALNLAAEYVERADPDAQLYRRLLAGMRKHNMGAAYRGIMGVEMPE